MDKQSVFDGRIVVFFLTKHILNNINNNNKVSWTPILHFGKNIQYKRMVAIYSSAVSCLSRYYLLHSIFILKPTFFTTKKMQNKLYFFIT